MRTELNRPSPSVLKSADRVLTPAVSSHSPDQWDRSRPEVCSSARSRSPSSLLPLLNVDQAEVGSSRASLAANVAAQVAKDSLSHKSSHHFIVTRSPNHMWDSSCKIVFTRTLWPASVCRLRKT